MSAALAALLAILIGATAQQPAAPPAAPPPVSATPERTTASYGDWTLRCERPGLPAGASHICEIEQAITVQGQQAPIAQIAFGRIQKSDPLKATIVLPPNATLSSPVMRTTGEKDQKLLDTSWQRCLPIDCREELPLRDELLRWLPVISEPGAILFKDAYGLDIRRPLSCRGLAQALICWAMNRLARHRLRRAKRRIDMIVGPALLAGNLHRAGMAIDLAGDIFLVA
ncbi:invasion associated locus B family protein [Bosea sp. (in: a-proteobacteria)]|uniref:invasion associated locus B family protein n=1 Tax=Bosea sp. (in: a-proteobacteria) TaxID=1871050 RepID=UPI003F70011B